MEGKGAPFRGAKIIVILIASLALLTAGCLRKGNDGFQVWLTNFSTEARYVIFEGEATLGEIEDPEAASYLVPAGIRDTPGPPILVDDTLTGGVFIVDATCRVSQRYELEPGDFGITIEADGRISLVEYGFGQRPSTTDVLEPVSVCLGSP